MSSSIDDIGVKVGLEIHQQLATGRKLFCSCAQVVEAADDDDNNKQNTFKFQRRLRATKSELGMHDPAALFEGTKSKTTIEYLANPESSCLVEQDEEPPHTMDCHAKAIVLEIAAMLNSNIFEEIYPMRKTVVDGSNTTGFQRTMLVSQGGHYNVGSKKIGVQSICLEEDAAKILDRAATTVTDNKNIKRYGLERLGVPLVEIATDPFEAPPGQVREIALSLGRLLRSTRKVKRGLGSIRQDINISIRGGGNTVIEVKGVQQLEQLEKVIEYEAKRQHGLLTISQMIRDAGWNYDDDDDHNDHNDAKQTSSNNTNNTNTKKTHTGIDITHHFTGCKSKIIVRAIQNKHRIHALQFKNMAGIFGHSPYKGIRLGKEIAEMVRFFGIGGIFHSDELPDYGITDSDINKIKNTLEIKENTDAFLILAAPQSTIHTVTHHIIQRITDIKDNGIPADTRLALPDGTTKFLRPKPGAARMYPETDIPPIIVTHDEIQKAKNNRPKSWDQSIADMQKKYSINTQLATQLYDSEYLELFEEIVAKERQQQQQQSISPTFVASILCSTITNLERNGLDAKLLTKNEIIKTFEMLGKAKITKESVEIIFEEIMAGNAKTTQEAITNRAIGAISESELKTVINRILKENKHIISKQKDRAIGPLMGMVMKELRGKASGQTINSLLVRGIKEMPSD